MSIQPTARPADTGAPQPAAPVKTEPKYAENTVHVEGIGAGGLYSLNYERIVADVVGVRAGFSYMSMSASAGTASASASLMTFPITASYLGIRSRGGSNALELGGGATLVNASGSGSSGGLNASSSGFGAFGTAMVGYRFHPVDGAGFNFRVGAMALMGKGMSLSAPTDPDAFGVIPWFYISMGASF